MAGRAPSRKGDAAAARENRGKADVPAPARLVVRPLTPERMVDLEAIFEAKGCAEARGCWCMYYRVRGGGGYGVARDALKAQRKAALTELARGDPPPGLIGYRRDTPIGWVSLGPREDYARLANSRTMRAVDDLPVWSIMCFVVPSAYRAQGVARELLAGAVACARRRGVRLLEAYPVDRDVPGATHAPWFGGKSMFDAAGFAEVARHAPARPIMRLVLRGS